MGKSPCNIWKGNILSSVSSIRKTAYLFSTKPNPKNKGDNNASSEPTAYKYAPPPRKGDKTH